MELHNFEDINTILLKVFLHNFNIVFSEWMLYIFYVDGDKPEQNENIRCSDITAFCCRCAK